MPTVPVLGLDLDLPDDLPGVDQQARDEAARAHQRLDSLAPAAAYDDTLLVAAQAQLEARVATLEGTPDDDTDDTARASIASLTTRVANLESQPAGSGSTVRTAFDSLGADDTARFTELVRRYQAGWKGEVEFATRAHSCPVQIPTIAGIRWSGTGTPAGEFGTGTVITYTGPAGSSMFLLTKNTGYSYPSNGVSRDCRFSGIQFNAGNDRDFLPPAPSTAFDANYVQWYWTFHDCGWVGWRRVVSGWGTGLDLTGYTHLQSCSQTPFAIGGSECKWFVGGGLVDSGNSSWMAADQPFLDWSASKSVIGSVMLSARNKSYQLRVTYGHNSRCIGTEFDAPDSAPTAGHQVRFTGNATNFGFASCSFKGGDGILATSGATEITVDSCHFALNRGLARLEAGFTGVLVWGVNTYGTTPRVIYAARASQVICLDPRVTVKSLDGLTTLRQATA